MKTRTMFVSMLLVVGAVAPGCGDDDRVTSPASTPTTAAPAQVAERIVSLSATSTEMLFAIGAGELVVAVDRQSTYPPEAPTTELSGYEPNVEAIAAYEPELVVASSDDSALVDGLGALDIEVLVHEAAADLDDVYDQLAELGERTGHAGEAKAVTEQMRKELADIAAGAKGRRLLTAYWELDPTYYSVTSRTFIGTLLGLANVTSIADEAQAEANDYPQLSPEFIVSADPDLILLADTKCCQQSAATVSARPGWARLKAVTSGQVVALDDDVASRWGPRVVDLLRLIDAAAAEAAG